MKRILLILFAAALGWAQQDNGPKSAIIDLKYADPNRVYSLLSGMFKLYMKADVGLHVIAIAGAPDDVAAAVAAIKRLDVPTPPEPDVDLTVYLIYGLAQGPSADDIPQDLSSTVKQLHGLFGYRSYKLADSLMLRGRAARPYQNQL